MGEKGLVLAPNDSITSVDKEDLEALAKAGLIDVTERDQSGDITRFVLTESAFRYYDEHLANEGGPK